VRPRAVLVTMRSQTDEIEALVASLGYDVASIVRQRRDRPDPATYIGSGKLDEVAGVAREAESDLVVFDADLRAGQVATIERALGAVSVAGERRRDEPDGGRGGDRTPRSAADARGAAPHPEDSRAAAPRTAADSGAAARRTATGSGAAAPLRGAARRRAARQEAPPVRVFDRVRLILEIFARRATTQEGRLQVELARLRYEMPLVREYIARSKKGEHPGFLGGGEYGVDQYYDQIRRRKTRIERELVRLAGEREGRRRARRKGGFRLVALAGYTNAGKSSLLSALTSREVLVENRLFSTLETRTARVRGSKRDEEPRVLLTDTVGFIEDLPPFLVEAFHATLEEIALADETWLVLDASDPPAEIERKMRTSLAILRRSKERAPIRVVLTKADLLSPIQSREIQPLVDAVASRLDARELLGVHLVSARTRDGLDELIGAAA